MTGFRALQALGCLAVAAALAGCPQPKLERVEETPTPAPTPTPSPTPIQIPYQRLETAKLFNGIKLRTEMNGEQGRNAAVEREDQDSFTLDLQLNVKVPIAAKDIETLSQVNPELPTVLPGLSTMLENAAVSPFYEDLYRRKLERLENNLPRLERLLSRHNFFDCETMLELRYPSTGRKVLMIQADMDVDMDGSDSDRVAYVDGSIPNFQPMTSYAWPKKSDRPNPFLAPAEEKLKKLETEFAVKGLSPERNRDLRNRIGQVRYEVNRMKEKSFLVAEHDPYVVISLPIFDRRADAYAPALGDYCVVIYGNKLYPAIVGDVGPTFKAGEASLRLAREINARATPFNRPVSDLAVTYLFFPGTADSPFKPPDFGRWTARCAELLNEIGGFQGELHTWVDTVPPLPTPTPEPTPGVSPSPSAENTASPSATP